MASNLLLFLVCFQLLQQIFLPDSATCDCLELHSLTDIDSTLKLRGVRVQYALFKEKLWWGELTGKSSRRQLEKLAAAEKFLVCEMMWPSTVISQAYGCKCSSPYFAFASSILWRMSCSRSRSSNESSPLTALCTAICRRSRSREVFNVSKNTCRCFIVSVATSRRKTQSYDGNKWIRNTEDVASGNTFGDCSSLITDPQNQ